MDEPTSSTAFPSAYRAAGAGRTCGLPAAPPEGGAKNGRLAFRRSPRHVDREERVVTKVPASYAGLAAGDTVSFPLGGSGDNLAIAVSKKALAIGATVSRIPSFVLTANRPKDKEDDAENLALLARDRPELFYRIRPRDIDFIVLRVCQRALTDTMKDRIATEQRLLQRAEGMIFRDSPDGLVPEGDRRPFLPPRRRIASSRAGGGREARERPGRANALDIYRELFSPIEAWSRIAARIIAGIGDIRRHGSKPKFGPLRAHVMRGGKYADVPAVPVQDEHRHRQRRESEICSELGNSLRARRSPGARTVNRRPESSGG